MSRSAASSFFAVHKTRKTWWVSRLMHAWFVSSLFCDNGRRVRSPFKMITICTKSAGSFPEKQILSILNKNTNLLHEVGHRVETSQLHARTLTDTANRERRELAKFLSVRHLESGECRTSSCVLFRSARRSASSRLKEEHCAQLSEVPVDAVGSTQV